MSSSSHLVTSAAHSTPERREGDLTLDDLYSPTNDDLMAVMAGMVEDCNRYFKIVNGHELNAKEQACRIEELSSENSAIQAQLDDAQSVIALQAEQLEDCRSSLRVAEQKPVNRSTRHSMISIHELNEQLQLAATKHEREKSMREKLQILQAEVKVLRFELTQCKRDKQDLLTKMAQLSIVDKQQSAAIINARDECGKGHMQLSCQKLHEVKAAGKEEPADLARKDSGVCSSPQREVVTPTRRLSVLPLQPIGSDSSQHGTGCIQNNAGSIIPCRTIRMIGPDAGDAGPDPEGRKVAGGSFELTTNACLEEPLAIQGSCEHPLIPLDVRDIIRSASFTQHTSTEDEPHLEPNTVMCSQVLKCMPPLMRHNVVFDGTALAEEFSSGSSGPGRVKPLGNLASHPIKASASNEPSEIMLEGAGGIQSSHDGTCVGPTWTNGAELRQDSSLDADEPVAVGPGDGLRPPTSLERQVSSVSLAESDTCLCAASDIKGKGVSEIIPKESSADMSRTSVCSHDENLHQPDGAVPADALPPLSARCQNRTPFNQKVGDRKASAKRPLQTTSIDRARLRQPHARLVDTPVKSAQGHHTSGTRQEWRLAGSSIRVRPDSGRPKSAFVMSESSTLGLPATPRRTKVISPHKARTPDMSRLLGTPQQQRQARRKPYKLTVRSSLDDLSSVQPCSQGVTARRATIAPGTTMPSYVKSDLKAGSCCTHHEKQRWL